MTKAARISLIVFLLLLLIASILLFYLFFVQGFRFSEKREESNFEKANEATTQLPDAISEVIGKDWEDNKFWNEEIQLWGIRFATLGKLMDHTSKPIVLKLAAGEEVKILVSVEGSYFDKEGKLASVILPIVMDLPNGKTYYMGGPKMEPYVSWPREIMFEEVNNLGRECNTCIDDGKDTVIFALIITDMEGMYEYLGINPEINDNPRHYIAYISDEYQKANKAKFDAFMADGNPGIKYIIPIELSKSGRKLNLSP